MTHRGRLLIIPAPPPRRFTPARWVFVGIAFACFIVLALVLYDSVWTELGRRMVDLGVPLR